MLTLLAMGRPALAMMVMRCPALSRTESDNAARSVLSPT
jgi:hypothetical protein